MVGKTVKGSSETVEGSRVGKVGIREGRTNQVGGVCADVSSFVVRVNGQITSDAFLDFVLVVSQHVRVVCAPIEVRVRSNDFTTLEDKLMSLEAKIPCRGVYISMRRLWGSWR